MAIFKVTEFHFLTNSKLHSTSYSEFNVIWQTPPIGWHKLNIDDSCCTNHKGLGPIAAGGIIKDHMGKWVTS